jgi:hypothetical protein
MAVEILEIEKDRGGNDREILIEQDPQELMG